MTVYDEIAEANADDECRAWVRRLVNAKDEIVAFVDARLDGRGAGEYLGFFKGSFNVSLHVGFGGRRPSALIRFPKPGHSMSPWRLEKVANEVRFIECLREHTTIPLPVIRCWGASEEGPQQLGPFIIMDFVEGVRLSSLLREPTEDDQADLVLNPAIDEATLDTIYDQLADYLFQLSQLEFLSIGAISKDDCSNTWTVGGRALTYNMNELATNTGYPVDRFPVAPFEHASEFFEAVARQHPLHLKAQRNLAADEDDVRRRFVARHRFQQLIPKYCIDDAGPFRAFCDDMRPANMLVDPGTLRITALLDFEFANSMPAQFTYDPPWWMEQFLRALERVEEKAGSAGDRAPAEEQSLSARMRESWKTGRFWFNYAARTSLDDDDVYRHALEPLHDHASGDHMDLLDEAVRGEMELLVRVKMEHRKAYEAESAARFHEK